MDQNTLDQRATTLENNALTTASAADLLPAKLREAVTLRFQNSPIVAQRDAALGTFLNEPAQTRQQLATTVKGGTILSPEQQNVIASGNRTNATIPLLSANDLLARETGGIEGLISAGVGAYNAKVKAEQGSAELARKQADTAFDRFIKNAELKIKQQEANSKYGAGAGANATTLAYIEQLKNGTIKNITAIPTEERNKVVALLTSSGINVNDVQKQASGNTVKNLLSNVYNSYFNGGVGGESLAAGRIGGGISNLLAGLGKNAKVSTYNDLINGTLAGLKSLTGDTGILTDQDAARLAQLLPRVNQTKQEAQLSIKNIDSLLQGKYGISLTGPVKVVDKKTGQVGTIDGMYEFDPNQYEIIP